MIKVLKGSLTKKTECKNCYAVLEYEYNDVKSERIRLCEYNHIITCPCCKKNTPVGKW